MSQFLLVLCGIPSSGKTSLARAILEQFSSKDCIELVSTDSWRDEQYYSQFEPEKENEVRRKALKMTHSLLQEGKSVIHDDTNYYASMRHELYSIAIKTQCRFGVVYVSTPLKNALDWNAERGNPVPPEVITRISQRFDTPGKKYAWDRPVFSINLAEQSINDCMSSLTEIIEELNPVSSEVKSQIAKQNEIDMLTRKVVGKFLKKKPKYQGHPEVSRIRKDVLREAIRKGMSSNEAEDILLKRLAGIRN
ncbi:MAG: AAA family ATPase [Candidatus Thorarchaeota archaeon]